MPISIVERLTLYADQVGLVASLRAQPLKADGAATGALITTGFVALGGADYRFAGNVPDDTECVRYELSSDAGVAIAVGDRVANLQTPTVGQIADAVWDEALSGHAIAGSAGKALADAGSSASQVITKSGPSTLTALDGGIDGTIGLFVGDLYSLTIKATIGSDPPGGTGATWTASTTDEATGAAIVSDAPLTEISEELGYFAYALAAGDTTSARRVRLTVKRALGSDVRIFGPLVLNVRDR